MIPFVDANLRTPADRKHRAVAGISMGGFGAMHLAQLHPDLFGQVASMSGDVDLSGNEMVLREVVLGSLVDAAPVTNWSYCRLGRDGYAPAVDSDALFGWPYPISWTPPYNESLWNAADPTQHASAFVGLATALTDAGQTPYVVDYGNGSSWGCDGGHDPGCWDRDLADLLPGLHAAFAAS